MPLSDDEREQIRIEEHYRAVVKEELSRNIHEGTKSPVLEFLNTNFGLWILSAIFIAGIGGAVSYWQHERDQAHAREERKLDAQRAEHAKLADEDRARREQETARLSRVAKLDREISFRLSHILVELARVVDATNHPQLLDAQARDKKLENARACLHAPADSQLYGGLYPEFASYTLPALVAELRNETPASHDREELDQVLHVLALWRSEPPYPADTTGRMLLGGVVLVRWRNYGFPFTDCAPTKQFPCYQLGSAR